MRTRTLSDRASRQVPLGRESVNVVVEAVAYAVDVGKPTVPARPLPMTYPSLSEARHPYSISIQAAANYCRYLPFEIVSGRSHSEMWKGCSVCLTTLVRSSLIDPGFISQRGLIENPSSVLAAPCVPRDAVD